MLIKEKLGTLADFTVTDQSIDRLALEWWECGKRILHKKTASGRDVVLKFFGSVQELQENDVLYADEKLLIVVEVLSCEVIVITPGNLYEMAYASYEIGNKHLPLFFENGSLLIPYDAPVYRMLKAAGFAVEIQQRKLLHQLRTSISPHKHIGDEKESLFSKILKMTTSSANE